MSDLRTAAQQALEALKTGGWNMTTRAIADLERALAQQDEPVAGCETEADCTSQPWCRIRGECQRKQAEPVRSPSTPQEKEMTDPNSVCFSLNTGAFPVEMLRLDGSGFHYKGKVIEDAGEAYNLFKQWLVMAQQPSQEAEPVAGKVVAWGVFANADGEWQLQHPVFAGDEQGKASAEFERASYSGPQPLEVRPLGVVTATAQQAEPVEPAKPVAQQAKPLTGLDMFLDPADGLKPKPYKPRAEPVLQTRKDGHYSVAYRCKCGHEQNVTEIVQGGRTYAGSGANWCDGCGDGPPVRVDAMQQQAEPVQKPVNAAIKAVEEGK